MDRPVFQTFPQRRVIHRLHRHHRPRRRRRHRHCPSQSIPHAEHQATANPGNRNHPRRAHRSSPPAHLAKRARRCRPLRHHHENGPRSGHQSHISPQAEGGSRRRRPGFPAFLSPTRRTHRVSRNFRPRLHHHRHGQTLSRSRPRRHRPPRPIPHPQPRHVLPRRRRTRPRIQQILQVHDRHRRTPQLPGKKYSRHPLPRLPRRSRRFSRPTLRQILPHSETTQSSVLSPQSSLRHPRHARFKHLRPGADSHSALQSHRSHPRRNAQWQA